MNDHQIKRTIRILQRVAGRVTWLRLAGAPMPRVDRLLHKVAEALETELSWNGPAFAEGDVVRLRERVPGCDAKVGEHYVVAFVHPRTRRLHVEDDATSYSVPSYACEHAPRRGCE